MFINIQNFFSIPWIIVLEDKNSLRDLLNEIY